MNADDRTDDPGPLPAHARHEGLSRPTAWDVAKLRSNPLKADWRPSKDAESREG